MRDWLPHRALATMNRLNVFLRDDMNDARIYIIPAALARSRTSSHGFHWHEICRLKKDASPPRCKIIPFTGPHPENSFRLR